MNNFPNVMSNLGIGVEESKEAIKDLSERLKGIPTTLDSAALSVERFTSKNGDVKKSVEIFTAINNALLAGGASSEIQASALEQLSQAYAKGKPDMVEWRSIQTAMPAQLKQVAEAMGMTTDELGEGLRKGGVEMDDFIETMIRLNKEGTGQFQSFEKQAKNATGGIKTSITNAKTAIVRGVANIVSAIDDGLSKTSLGGLGKVISNVGSIAEKWLKNISNLIKKIDFNSTIKKIQNSFTLNGNKIKQTLNNLGKIFNNVISIVKSFTPVIEKVVDAFFSLVNIAGKVGVALSEVSKYIVSDILGLTQEKKAIHDLIREQESQTTTWQGLKEAREQTLSTSSKEIATTQSLAKELKNITDENGKVKEGYENRAKYILGELNNALDTEYTMNDNIITQYEELKNNIDQLIAKKKAEMTLEAYKSEYQNALTEQNNATKELAKLTKEYNKQLGIANDTSKTIAERNDAKTQANNLEEAIGKQQKLISEYGYTLEKYNNLTSASISGNAEEINKAISEITTSYDEAKTKADNSLASQVQSQSEYVNLIEQNLKRAKETNDKYSQNILESELKTQKEQLQNLVKSFGDRTSSIESLSSEEVTAWSILARNNKEEYLRELNDLPEETKKKIEKAIDGVKNTESLLNGTFSKLGEENKIQFGNQLKLKETVQDKMAQAGVAIQNDTTVNNASKILANNASEGFNNNVNGSKWGTDLAQNIATGMESKQSKSIITRASEGIAGIIKSIMGHSVPAAGPLKDELTYMPDMINNLVEGIEKNKYKVEKATNRMAQGIKEGFNLDGLNNEIMREMNKAVAIETGSINATASVKANNSMLSVIQASFNIDGSVDIDGKKAGRILAPSVVKTIKTGGLA